MLLFSTKLDISEEMGKDDFIRLIIDWNQNSPHTINVIPGLEWHGERSVRYGDESRWLSIQEFRNQEIIAARYEKKTDDGVIWDSDYVMNFRERKMSIRLDRSYTEEALAGNPQFSTPYFISTLIDAKYLKDDGDLPVLSDPIMINMENAELLPKIIRDEKQYQLPVVYVSKTFHDEYPVDIDKLAYRLKGVAHVLVQESGGELTAKLREICDGQNEYNGAIGIYYPNPSVGHRRYLHRDASGVDPVTMEQVIRHVIHYCNSQRMDTCYTWQGVMNQLLMDKLTVQKEKRLLAETARQKAEEKTNELLESLDEEQRRIQKEALDNASEETNKILESFEDDLRRMQEQIETLSRRNEALEAENQGLRAKYDSADSRPVIYTGEEQEFFPGEIRDYILSILDKELPNIPEGTRKNHVIRDILKKNEYKGLVAARREKLKGILAKMDRMTDTEKQELKDLGFRFERSATHYVFTYFGDPRYSFTISKTPSEYRTRKNEASRVVMETC